MPDCRITCLVDNSVTLSSELWGEHGLSFLLEVGESRLLLDTGQSGAVLRHNLDALKLAGGVQGIILSHGHYDHTGGLHVALDWAPGAAVMAHPQAWTPRFSKREENGRVTLKPIGQPFSQQEIAARAPITWITGPTQIAPGLWTTGEVARSVDQGMAEPRHVVEVEGELRPDPFADDMSLVVETPRGLVVVLGCCHAGLLNTLAHVRGMLKQPIVALVGGSHLDKATQEQLGHIARVLRDEYGLQQLYLNHCTGRAAHPLGQMMEIEARPCPAGTVLTF